MSKTPLEPNELADLYEALFTLAEQLPKNTHPGWDFAIESVLFGGEGLADGATSYGEQQAERNDFKITDYREKYGNNNHVTEFPSIETRRVTPEDEPTLGESIQLPVAPSSQTVLPLFVDDDIFSQAISLLAELPAEPEADHAGHGQQQLLNPNRFPGIGTKPRRPEQEPRSNQTAGKEQPEHEQNELAELYESLRVMHENLPENAHPRWAEALETILFGGEYLLPGRAPYGEQQAERNDFTMDEYRSDYGDGDRVTEYSIVERTQVDSPQELDAVPNTPESNEPLPISPDEEALAKAFYLLEEFPRSPKAVEETRLEGSLLFTQGLIEAANVQDTQVETTSASETDGKDVEKSSTTPSVKNADSEVETGEEDLESGPIDTTDSEPLDSKPKAASEPVDTEKDSEETIIHESGVGESFGSVDEADIDDSESKKYEDPRAQRAHERAQQRDPSEIVGLGEEIELVLKEVDHNYQNPTIMGRKNDLVIFVDDAPQDVTRLDKIQVQVVDYGGNNNCAHAVFTGYAD